MITDEQAERAGDFILEHAPKFAQAKADRVYIEHFLKSKRALLFNANMGTVAERENAALASDVYIELLDGLKEAVTIEETLKWQLTAAQIRVDTWRTQQASHRL